MHAYPTLAHFQVGSTTNDSQPQMVQSPKWFTAPNCSQPQMVHSPKWSTAPNGSQPQMVHSIKWSTAPNGSQPQMVHNQNSKLEIDSMKRILPYAPFLAHHFIILYLAF